MASVIHTHGDAWRKSCHVAAIVATTFSVLLLGCSSEFHPSAPQLTFTGPADTQDSLPVYNGDVTIHLEQNKSGPLIVEIATELQHAHGEDEGLSSGEFRGGQLIKTTANAVLSASSFAKTGPGRYWIRGGVFCGQKEWGILVTLIEIPIDQRFGYLLWVQDGPQGMIRNAYCMGKFQPFLWKPKSAGEATITQTASGETTSSPKTMVDIFRFVMPEGFVPVPPEKATALQMAMEQGGKELSSASGLGDAKGFRIGKLTAYEGNGYLLVFYGSNPSLTGRLEILSRSTAYAVENRRVALQTCNSLYQWGQISASAGFSETKLELPAEIRFQLGSCSPRGTTKQACRAHEGDENHYFHGKSKIQKSQ